MKYVGAHVSAAAAGGVDQAVIRAHELGRYSLCPTTKISASGSRPAGKRHRGL